MEVNYPSLAKRIQSIFIDSLLIIVLMFLSGWILDKMNPEQNEGDEWIRIVLFIALWGVYEPLSMTLGCTLGNYLMKIRVRKHNNAGKKMNLLQAYARFIIKFFLGWLSFITISFNPERRAIHDFASGSIVVEKIS
ncbi:MAG TPA: RDD family protein [Chitinophagaceae bacterium]|jgi:uncharacterized RDD family membrane protein YckC|nr:RDD family protein [Chitinophagaceae bacterium]